MHRRPGWVRIAEMTVVFGDASSNLHASERGRLDDDDFMWKALGYERLRQTVDLARHQVYQVTAHNQPYAAST